MKGDFAEGYYDSKFPNPIEALTVVSSLKLLAQLINSSLLEWITPSLGLLLFL